jgi:hypothetical protein
MIARYGFGAGTAAYLTRCLDGGEAVCMSWGEFVILGAWYRIGTRGRAGRYGNVTTRVALSESDTGA